MADTKIQLRRLETAVRLTKMPAMGEPIWDIEENRLYIGDGVTVGGVVASGGIETFTDNFRIRPVYSGVDAYSFRTDEAGFLRSYNAAGTETGAWRPETGYFNVSGAITAGSPTNPVGGNISFGVAGSVNGKYGLFSNDVHSLDTVYGSQGVVVGFGRQNHTHDGSLWLATKGSVTGVPTAGSQETRAYTDESGTHFQNHHALAEQGSVGTAFHFDDALQPTGGYKAPDGTAPFTGIIPAGAAIIVKGGIITGYTGP